jgi:hypothetical protein
MAEFLLAYLEHASHHYRDRDGKATSELVEVKLVVKALHELYADLLAAEFGALKLKAGRQGWVAGVCRAGR